MPDGRKPVVRWSSRHSATLNCASQTTARLTGEKQNMDICIAKGLGYFGMGGQGGSGSLKSLAFSPKMLAEAASHPEWVKFLEGGAFPLKMTSTDNGKVTMNMEATKIEKKSLDDSLFVVPPDYKEFNVGNFGGGV